MAKRKAPTRKRTSPSGRKRTSRAAAKTRRTKRVRGAKAIAKTPRTSKSLRKGQTRAAKAQAPAKARSAKKARSPKRSRATKSQATKSQATKSQATKKAAPARATRKPPRLDRERRTLEDAGQTPPSSLDMVRRGTAVRTGRAEVAESLREHKGMSPSIAGGDVDVNVEDAYFTGDEAPGGDNPAPDQEVVDDIGKALGVEYQDNEELKASDKITERDRHRWELDPASSEDYKDRK